jgi:hypothetical protein
MISKIFRLDIDKEKYEENYCVVQAYEAGSLPAKRPRQGEKRGI